MKKLLVALGLVSSFTMAQAANYYNYTLSVNNQSKTPLTLTYNAGANVVNLPANQATTLNVSTSTIYSINMNNNALTLSQNSFNFVTQLTQTAANSPYTIAVNSGSLSGSFATNIGSSSPTGACQGDGVNGVSCKMTAVNGTLSGNALGITISGGPTGDGGGTTCTTASTWNTTQAYDKSGTYVVYSGVLYQSKWWTQGQNPASNSGTDGPWKRVTSC